MSRDEFETELTTDREDAASIVRGVADGVLAGAVRLGDGAHTVAVPAELSVEVEFEVDDEASLEVELEWPTSATAGDDVPAVEGAEDHSAETAVEGISADVSTEEAPGDSPSEDAPVEEPPADPEGGHALAGPAGDPESRARFEVYRDRGGEWRWRLRHRNGNVIATSGEGYTRKHNARKGLRSVMTNAPAAKVREEETT